MIRIPLISPFRFYAPGRISTIYDPQQWDNRGANDYDINKVRNAYFKQPVWNITPSAKAFNFQFSATEGATIDVHLTVLDGQTITATMEHDLIATIGGWDYYEGYLDLPADIENNGRLEINIFEGTPLNTEWINNSGADLTLVESAGNITSCYSILPDKNINTNNIPLTEGDVCTVIYVYFPLNSAAVPPQLYIVDPAGYSSVYPRPPLKDGMNYVSFKANATGNFLIYLFTQTGITHFFAPFFIYKNYLKSEVIDFSNELEECYPVTFDNFENDFGWLFDVTTTDYPGMITIPLQVYKPANEMEKEVYEDDPGIVTTLRSTPKRIQEFETYPIPMWFAEKILLICNCSALTISGVDIEVTEQPEITPVDGTNLCSVKGKMRIKNFSNDFLQEI